MSAESGDDEWNPEPAELRDGETRDDTAHARGNIKQIREILGGEYEIDEDRRERLQDRLDEMHAEVRGDEQ